MKITRDVITDLLPVYLAGEASADTKALIEAFLKDDPEFAKLIEADDAIHFEGQIKLPQEIEMDTLNETRKLLKQRSVYMAFTLLFLLLPASFKFNAQGIQWLWADTPMTALILLVLGLIFAFQYWRFSRKLKGTDL